ncbi:MAG: hypothetical protein MK132_08000 [Lentisphaerales bacterium]|nr:hypothetical protein [Lentisphaerales bacterium]
MAGYKSKKIRFTVNPDRLFNFEALPLMFYNDLETSLKMAKSSQVPLMTGGSDIVRLSLYLTEHGYLNNPKLTKTEFDAMIDGIVQSFIENDAYIILD